MTKWTADLDSARRAHYSGDRFKHGQDTSFKLFPLNTHGKSIVVNTGGFLQYACQQTSPAIHDTDDLVNRVLKSIDDIDSNDLAIAKDAIYDIAGNASIVDTSNLRMALGVECTQLESKVSWYLMSFATEYDSLRETARAAVSSINEEANLAERMIYEAIPLDSFVPKEEKRYMPVNESLQSVFAKDLDFVLSDYRIASEYLPGLLSFYFFMSVSETCMTLQKRAAGNRGRVEQLFFALDGEKTSQNRLCYKHGYRLLESAIEEMFVHAATLEYINSACSNDQQYDYIALMEQANESPEEALKIAEQLRGLTDLYRTLTKDGERKYIDDLTPADEDPCNVVHEIDYLWDNIRTIIHSTSRDEPRNKYAKSFREFSQSGLRFVKSRGRSGTMLNLTDDALLLLSVLSIGHSEQLSLIELFQEYEARGVFLDQFSKEAVASFFEKRNMIDKKSDSGETQYVRRFL